MNVTRTSIPDVLILEPKVFGDSRGHFFESYNRRTFELIGIKCDFVQDNQSKSQQNVVRALHYQIQHTQGKLVRAISGRIYDVAVDIRRSSPTFGKWVGAELTAENHMMLWIPRGFAHGFSVLSDTAEVGYKADEFYSPQDERTIIWNDPEIGVDWHLQGEAILSPRDLQGKLLREAEVFA